MDRICRSSFTFLAPSGSIAPPLASEPLEDDHDYDYLVMQACRILSDAGCRFHIAGFGSADWGFDVSYDMATFIEQVPDLIAGLESNGVGEVDSIRKGSSGLSFSGEWGSRMNCAVNPGPRGVRHRILNMKITPLLNLC